MYKTWNELEINSDIESVWFINEDLKLTTKDLGLFLDLELSPNYMRIIYKKIYIWYLNTINQVD